MLEQLTQIGYEIECTNHSQAILERDFQDQLDEIEAALSTFRLTSLELIEGGGGEAPFTQRLRREISKYGWLKHNFTITKTVDGDEKESMSHEIDHVRATANGTLALEIEWNNKSEFYDRDLENFKRLHAEGVFSVAILVTRGQTFQDNVLNIVSAFADANSINSFADLEKFENYDPSRKFKDAVNHAAAKNNARFREVWVKRFVSSKYAATTTHWNKLQERIRRGVGSPCPMLLIGIPSTIIN
jgi:hypothetical protein